MIGSVIDHAKLTVDSTISHYTGRFIVVLPILVALGFATATGYLLLVERVGPVQACAVMSGAFIVVSVLVAMIVLVQERNQRLLLRQSAQDSALVAGLLTAAPVALAGGGSLLRMAGGLKAPLLVGAALLAAALATKGGLGDQDAPTT